MIYLEALPDQSTAADLRSQCRFITQQGIQKLIVCDNETVLKGRSLKRCSTGQGKKWSYNLSQISWCRGLFEHLICFAKRCLIKSAMKMKLTYK